MTAYEIHQSEFEEGDSKSLVDANQHKFTRTISKGTKEVENSQDLLGKEGRSLIYGAEGVLFCRSKPILKRNTEE